jgi:hypothetical protein
MCKADVDFFGMWKEAGADLSVLSAAKKEHNRTITVSSQGGGSPR